MITHLWGGDGSDVPVFLCPDSLVSMLFPCIFFLRHSAYMPQFLFYKSSPKCSVYSLVELLGIIFSLNSEKELVAEDSSSKKMHLAKGTFFSVILAGGMKIFQCSFCSLQINSQDFKWKRKHRPPNKSSITMREHHARPNV